MQKGNLDQVLNVEPNFDKLKNFEELNVDKEEMYSSQKKKHEKPRCGWEAVSCEHNQSRESFDCHGRQM